MAIHTVVKPSECVNLVIVDEGTAGSAMILAIERSGRFCQFKNRSLRTIRPANSVWKPSSKRY
jgi:hypothetical protein